MTTPTLDMNARFVLLIEIVFYYLQFDYTRCDL